ncbi:MAG TPA: hypothetical protein DCO68_10175 [Methylophilaceae bacterium]|nr:hypothetical protein [Methylophilaceae bacterium]
MGVLNKANIPPPVLPKEVVDVPELGGEVVVTGLMLSDRVNWFISKDRKISDLLACTVIDANNEPIYTSQEWEQFGSKNFSAALKLFQKAKELSGLDVELNQKKS